MRKRFFCTLLILISAVSLFLPALSAGASLYDAQVELSAQHALVISLNTNNEVFSKSPDETLYPASTTKIMTAILAIEKFPDLTETVTVTESAMKQVDISSSQVGLKVGESLSLRDLLALMMVKSGSDAACVLAEHTGGSVSAFVDRMNDKAEELGCTSTHFVNPTGMHNADHYSTARDMATITLYALRNPTFVEFFNMKQVSVEATELSGERFFSTTNFLIDLNRGGNYYYKYAVGGKTGTTTPAGRCLISTAQKGDVSYLCLVFGADGNNAKNTNEAFPDSKKLFTWCFENLTLTKVASKDEVLFETKLRYAWNHDFITFTVSEDVYALLPADMTPDIKRDDGTGTLSGLVVSADIPEKLDAPVVKGDEAGTVTYIYRDESGEITLGSGKLAVYESVDRNILVFIFTKIGAFFTSKAALVLIAILLLLLIIYIIIRVVIKSKSRRNRRYRRHYRGYKRY